MFLMKSMLIRFFLAIFACFIAGNARHFTFIDSNMHQVPISIENYFTTNAMAKVVPWLPVAMVAPWLNRQGVSHTKIDFIAPWLCG